MDKEALLGRLSRTAVADLPSHEVNEFAQAIAKLSEGKAPVTMGQKRMFISNWLTDNGGGYGYGSGGGGGGGGG
eukprot:CAMPEP_0179876666 /NCGR_PEP_ID=MMETSP0982-20121206/24347_1 /TAXON_ID=483367 /ORGANISM="non described non described, Strain CCMP 2436" /LENGTH=73 /DNA_ID=CAMNT_0021769151 /DNA_START=30 /DNA_END=248 /DNA_ORIENTATION=-